MLTVTEAAKQLGIPARTLRLWCRQGRVPGAEMVGPIWLVPDLPVYHRPPPPEELIRVMGIDRPKVGWVKGRPRKETS